MLRLAWESFLLSNIATRIANAKRELLALKAGFAGDEQRFFTATATEETFNISSNDPIIIRADFEYRDFPQLYVRAQYTVGAFPPVLFNYDPFVRTNLYEWRMSEETSGVANWTINAVLVSQRTPTLFTIEAES